jgi:hypothetical protein
VPGKETLLVHTQKGQGYMSSQMAMLRRLYDKYHKAGLEIILVVPTQGFSWSSPPQTPEEEAKTDEWYFFDYLKVPFTVVIEQTQFTRKPDGRLVPGPTAFGRQYPVGSVLVGRDGKIYTEWVGLESESQLNAVIPQALAAQPAVH